MELGPLARSWIVIDPPHPPLVLGWIFVERDREHISRCYAVGVEIGIVLSSERHFGSAGERSTKEF